jgi:hypothetical protein
MDMESPFAVIAGATGIISSAESLALYLAIYVPQNAGKAHPVAVTPE